MMRQQIVKKIQKNERTLRENFRISELWIFGSLARGNATKRSDIDILVSFGDSRIGLFEFIRLKNFLETILKRRVDLVTRDALKDWMIEDVERHSFRAA